MASIALEFNHREGEGAIWCHKTRAPAPQFFTLDEVRAVFEGKLDWK